jgi:hypothetical protein
VSDNASRDSVQHRLLLQSSNSNERLHIATIRKLGNRPARIERERKADTWQRIQTFWAMLRSAINVVLLHSNLVLEMTFFRKSRWHLTNAALSIYIRHTECDLPSAADLAKCD